MQSQDNKQLTNTQDAPDTFGDRCRQAHLRITPQRQAVFAALAACHDHPTAETLYHRVRQQMPNISFDTVNRTLNTLCRIGAAFIVPGSDTVRRFDGNLGDHQHFRCVRCKSIVDFHHEALDNIRLPDELAQRFVVLRKTVCVEGLCDQCARGGRPE